MICSVNSEYIKPVLDMREREKKKREKERERGKSRLRNL